jgi:tetratricopeptide (TPR) repeat protein
MIINDKERMVEEAELALRSDPLSLIKNNQLGEALLTAGRIDEAEKQFLKTLELDPQWRTPLRNLFIVYIASGDYQKSYEFADRIRREVNQPGKGITGLIIVLAHLGKKEEAYQWLEQLLRRFEEDSTVALHGDLCVCYAALGDLDKAFYYLDLGYEKNVGIIFFGIRYPLNLLLNKDERYWQLIEKMGLKKYYEDAK